MRTAASIILVLALAFTVNISRAADITVSAVVEPGVIAVGGEVTLVVTVKGKFRKTASPELPPLDEFSIFQAGTSQSFSFSNGQRNASLQFTYVLVAKKEGTYTIEPVRFESDNKVYTANPVTIEVVQASTPAQLPTRSGDDRGAEKIDASIFVTAQVDRDTVYVNQQVTWTLNFYSDGRTDLLRSPEYTPPSAEGFWIEDLPPQQNYYETINARRYLINEIKRAFFPTVPGEYTIGAARVDIVTNRTATSIDGFSRRRSRLFGFGKTTSLKTDAIRIVVLPLPRDGRPENFSGLVGRNLELSLQTDKQVVETGEPVNLALQVKGEGNFKMMAAPEIPELDGFKMYESGSKSDIFKKDYIVSGRKKSEFVLVPKTEGKAVIPPVRISYFDPVDAIYRTVQSTPIEMVIKPGTKEQGGRQVVFTGTGENIEVLGKDINYIHPVPADVSMGKNRLYRKRLYIALHTLPLLALVFSIGVERRRNRWKGNAALARASRAYRDADKKFKRAATSITSGREEESFSIVSGALRDYLADKANLAASGLTFESIDDYLAQTGASEESRRGVADVLRVCDRVQYTPGTTGDGEAALTLENARRFVKQIEREVG